MRIVLLCSLLFLPSYALAQESFQPTIDEIMKIQENVEQGKRPTVLKEDDTLSPQERVNLMNRLNRNFNARRGHTATTRTYAKPSTTSEENELLRQLTKQQLEKQKSRLMGQ